MRSWKYKSSKRSTKGSCKNSPNPRSPPKKAPGLMTSSMSKCSNGRKSQTEVHKKRKDSSKRNSSIMPTSSNPRWTRKVKKYYSILQRYRKEYRFMRERFLPKKSSNLKLTSNVLLSLKLTKKRKSDHIQLEWYYPVYIICTSS